MADLVRPVAGMLALTAGLLSVLAGEAVASKVGWHTDLRQAAAESNRSHKPMLLKFTADWCGHCHRLQKSFDDERVAAQVESCFVPVLLDADAEPELARSLGIDGLPATLIISPDLKVLKRIDGYRTPQQLNRELGTVCETPRQPQPRHPPYAGPITPVARVEPGCAFGGHCLVTLLEEQALVDGSDSYSASFQGTKLCFATAEHKQRFESNPEKYWPILDGRCLVEAVETGEALPGRPEWGAVYRGRLWFFVGPEQRQRFADDPTLYLNP